MITAWIRRRLSVRLAMIGGVIGAIAVLVVTVAAIRVAERTLQWRQLEVLDGSASAMAQRVERWLYRQQQAAALYAGELPSDADRLPTFDRELLTTEEVELIEVPGGRVLASTQPVDGLRYRVEQLYYREGRERPFAQAVYPSGADGRPRLTVAAPVRDANGVTTRVLAAHLDMTTLEQLLARPDAGVPVEVYLVNRYAEFVSAERFGRAGLRRGAHSRAIDNAIAGRSGSGLYADYAGTPVIGAWRWLPSVELALLMEARQDVAFAPVAALRAQVVGIGIVAVALLIGAVTVLARRATEPLEVMSRVAERIADGDFDVAAPEDRSDEIGRLGQTLNRMTGRLQSLYGAFDRQVRETAEALEEAQRSRALLQDVVDKAATPVLVVDNAGVVLLANDEAAALLNVSAAGLRRATLATLDAPGGAAGLLAGLLEEARRSSLPMEQEVELGGTFNRHVWQLTAFPLAEADGRVYGAGLIATDLTERARAEAERRAHDATVQQAQKLESLGVMAGGIAHDFNNLLGAILGNVELARQSLDDRAHTDEALAQIAAASRRAAELTRQMLAYAGRASFKRETVDARRVIDDLVPLVRAAQPKKVQIDVMPMPEPLWVELDPAQLSQVLLNLLTNAAEAIGDGSGVVRVSADGEAPLGVTSTTTRWVHLIVSDTGIGMAADVRARIFDPFFTTKTSGRGLGLSAVRGIVQSLGGQLDLESEPGLGTRFDIYLPAAEAPAPASAAEAAPSLHVEGATILVVDDEAPVRNVVRRALGRIGLTVEEAEDGAAGVAAFRAAPTRYALVLLDLTMPRLSGAEVLAAIRDVAPTLPVIVASGYDYGDAMPEWGKDPHTAYLQKPFEIDRLQRLVSRMMAPPTVEVSSG